MKFVAKCLKDLSKMQVLDPMEPEWAKRLEGAGSCGVPDGARPLPHRQPRATERAGRGPEAHSFGVDAYRVFERLHREPHSTELMRVRIGGRQKLGAVVQSRPCDWSSRPCEIDPKSGVCA